MIGQAAELSVSEFVAVLNQTMEYSFGGVVIIGELANFRIAKDQWVYFDLKDETSAVSFFATVYNLPGPLEDGMMLKVKGVPKLHPRWGFKVNVISITPAGEGTIKRLSDLLRVKLEAEGLFAPERKRAIAYPPQKVGLITAINSAAYADFTRILSNRWGGLSILTYNVSVQGDQSVDEIVQAIKYFSDSSSDPPEVLVIIRGGGSPEDLAAFNSEPVVRAVAGSRIPTLVAIGHESDISLSELAADRRASTPSNAAEVLVPDKLNEIRRLENLPKQLHIGLIQKLKTAEGLLTQLKAHLKVLVEHKLGSELVRLNERKKLIEALSPKNTLKRGYAIVYNDGKVSDGANLKTGSIVSIELSKASFSAGILKRLKGNEHD